MSVKKHLYGGIQKHSSIFRFRDSNLKHFCLLDKIDNQDFSIQLQF